MKNTPSSILTALTADLAMPYLILQMEFTGGTVRLTNLPYDIVVGGNTYVADGGLAQLDPPKLTSVLDREVYRIRLVDFDNAYKAHFENNALGTLVTVSMGIEGNTSDFDILYKGRIDGMTIETSPAEGTKDAIIECASPFAALDRTNNRMTDKDTQRNIDATDSCMDAVYAAAKAVEIRWGKQ
jgi:hypothetical protein